MIDSEPQSLLKRRLKLDLATIMAVNEYLAELPDGPLEGLHGRITLEIVKGEFSKVDVTCSHLLQKQKRGKKTA